MNESAGEMRDPRVAMDKSKMGKDGKEEREKGRRRTLTSCEEVRLTSSGFLPASSVFNSSFSTFPLPTNYNDFQNGARRVGWGKKERQGRMRGKRRIR